MMASMSAFLFALITDRAFKMVWPGPFPAEAGWDRPNIDWTVKADSDLAKNTTGKSPALIESDPWVPTP